MYKNIRSVLTNNIKFSTLRHPNIVVFMGFAKDEDNLYIITNYVHGGDLYALLFKQVAIELAS